jgi:hypothetical protein
MALAAILGQIRQQLAHPFNVDRIKDVSPIAARMDQSSAIQLF